MSHDGKDTGSTPHAGPSKPSRSSKPTKAKQATVPMPSPSSTDSNTSYIASDPQRDSNQHTTSSATPPTSVWSTPEDQSGVADPFASLSINKPTNQAEHQQPSQPQPHNNQQQSPPAPPITTPSTSAGILTPSSTPSEKTSSEANDYVGPLPPSQYSSDRPSGSRAKLPSPKQLPRLPMPSPPATAWTISELLSGSPYHETNEDSYFPPVGQPSSSSRSGGHNRRTPPYSTFRQYHGPEGRAASHARNRSFDPRIPTDSPHSSVPEYMDNSATPRPPSDSPSSPSQSSISRRSPRVRNTGKVLAPHGSFTSAKPRSTMAPSSKSSATSSDPHSGRSGLPKNARPEQFESGELELLQKAAAQGDQLAMYRLGWRADTPHDKRYILGNVEDVWGPVSPQPPSSVTRRSSRSSQGSGYFASSHQGHNSGSSTGPRRSMSGSGGKRTPQT